MAREDRCCIEILEQIAAVRNGLDFLGVELLTNPVQTCVIGHGTESEHPNARARTATTAE